MEIKIQLGSMILSMSPKEYVKYADLQLIETAKLVKIQEEAIAKSKEAREKMVGAKKETLQARQIADANIQKLVMAHKKQLTGIDNIKTLQGQMKQFQ